VKLRACSACAAAVGFLTTSAGAIWMQPIDVPVGRLLTNVESYVEDHPGDPQGHFTLARIHSLAFADLAQAIPVYSGNRDDQSVPRIARFRSGQPQFGPTPGEPRKEDLIVHLRESIRSFERALALDSDSALSHLGLAYVLERGVVLADEVDGADGGARPGGRDDRQVRERWRERALDEYHRAYQLAIAVDGTITEQPLEGLASLASYEAGKAFVKLMTARGARDEIEKRRLAEVRQGIERLEATPPSRSITPIILSLDTTRGLRDLLAARSWVRFDLDGDDRPEPRPWVLPTTGMLVWDPSRAGVITSGRQLFGSVTWWMFFTDGYRAMDALDDDRDGRLAGGELVGLAVWFDRNTNGVSERGEVVAIEELPIVSLATRATSIEEGSPANRSGMTLADGRVLPTFDWIAPPVPATSVETAVPPCLPRAAAIHTDERIVVAGARIPAVDLGPGRHQPAIDGEGLPGNEAGLVGSEIEGRVRDVVDRSRFGPRLRSGRPLGGPLGLAAVHERRHDHARADGVDPYMVLGELDRRGLRQVDDPRLRGGVGLRTPAAAQPGDRGRVDDRPALSLADQDPRGMLDPQEHAAQEHRLREVPILDADLGDGAERAPHASVVEENVEAAEPLASASQHGDHLGFLGHVGPDVVRPGRAGPVRPAAPSELLE
jgi:hypothetical protein